MYSVFERGTRQVLGEYSNHNCLYLTQNVGQKEQEITRLIASHNLFPSLKRLMNQSLFVNALYFIFYYYYLWISAIYGK